MSDFGEGKWIVGRKRHRCDGCWAFIPEGEKHYNYRGIYDGDWQNWRMHEECHADYAKNGYEEFTSGDFPVPERICNRCGGTGETCPSGPSDAPMNTCAVCGGSGLARNAEVITRGDDQIARIS